MSVYRFADVHAQTLRRVDESSVSLRVERIVAYRRDFDEIDSGMTARLELAGDRQDAVQSGMVLGG